jgi:chromate transport protein ChrA
VSHLCLHIDDPGLFSLKRAARAAIVMPAVFAFADKVIQDSDTTLFAAFGSFAILVLGTLCSQTPWLAIAAMAVVGFAILFSGAISAYFAAAGLAVHPDTIRDAIKAVGEETQVTGERQQL